MASSRPARPKDIEEIALALPDVTSEPSWVDRPSFKVRGKAFVIYRGPRKDALDAQGEMIPDAVVISCTPDDKRALVTDPELPFFTTDHFDGYNAVLVRESELGGISRQELAEVITDAWLARAPKRLAAQWRAGHQHPAQGGRPPRSDHP
jgi:hypothetical protein